MTRPAPRDIFTVFLTLFAVTLFTLTGSVFTGACSSKSSSPPPLAPASPLPPPAPPPGTPTPPPPPAPPAPATISITTATISQNGTDGVGTPMYVLNYTGEVTAPEVGTQCMDVTTIACTIAVANWSLDPSVPVTANTFKRKTGEPATTTFTASSGRFYKGAVGSGTTVRARATAPTTGSVDATRFVAAPP